MKIQFSPEIVKAREAYLAVRKSVAKQLDSALQEWHNLSIKQIDEATTKNEALLAFRAAPWKTSAKAYALKKLAEVCNTKEELLDAYKKSRGRRFWYEKNPAFIKLKAVIGLEVDKATHIDEAESSFWNVLEVVDGAYCGEGMQNEAFKKWLSFCTTVEMLENLGRKMEGGLHGLNRHMYIKRLEEITGKKHIPIGIP